MVYSKKYSTKNGKSVLFKVGLPSLFNQNTSEFGNIFQRHTRTTNNCF